MLFDLNSIVLLDGGQVVCPFKPFFSECAAFSVFAMPFTLKVFVIYRRRRKSLFHSQLNLLFSRLSTKATKSFPTYSFHNFEIQAAPPNAFSHLSHMRNAA